MTSAIRYAVWTQAISSVLADSPPCIWVKELVTIWTSMIARNNPVPIARTPIQSRSCGASVRGVAAGGAGPTDAAPVGFRRDSEIRASAPQRLGEGHRRRAVVSKG